MLAAKGEQFNKYYSYEQHIVKWIPSDMLNHTERVKI